MPSRSKSAPSKPTITSTTLVIDNGAFSIKAGFASAAPGLEDCHVIPNCIARSRNKRTYIGAQLDKCNDFGEMAFRRPVEKGYVVSWEVEKAVWEQSFFESGATLKVCQPAYAFAPRE